MTCKMNPDEANNFLRQAFEGQSVRTEIVEMVEGRAVVRLRADKTNLRPGGYISGPTQMSLVDTAAYFAVMTVTGLEPMAVTSSPARANTHHSMSMR